MQQAVSAIRAQTWERINEVVLRDAKANRVEPGQRLRVDSTVTDAPVMVRLLEATKKLPGAPRVSYVNHTRVAKKRARTIFYTRSRERRAALYGGLIEATRATLGYTDAARLQLTAAGVGGIEFECWLAELEWYKPLIEAVIWQTERRVFGGESVRASEKIVGLFEPHTDIIIKGARKVQYGHKLNLSSGRSGLILDVVRAD